MLMFERQRYALECASLTVCVQTVWMPQWHQLLKSLKDLLRAWLLLSPFLPEELQVNYSVWEEERVPCDPYCSLSHSLVSPLDEPVHSFLASPDWRGKVSFHFNPCKYAPEDVMCSRINQNSVSLWI